MTPETWAFILLLAVVMIAAIVCAVFWKVAFQDGREAGILHERNMRNTDRIKRNRLDAATDEFRAITESADPFDNWLKQVVTDSGERLAGTGELRTLTDDFGQPDNLTTTGAFRALTDDWIAQMTAEETAYRKKLAS
jgi:hypothetical protein